jgi:ABC-type sugar transport system ATPase subunit
MYRHSPIGINSIELDGISLRVSNPDATLLNNVSIRIDLGHRAIAIRGPNGSGKTTLLKLLAGHPPQQSSLEGRLLVHRGGTFHEVTEFYDAEFTRTLGIVYVPQEPLLVPELNVFENLALGLEGSWWSTSNGRKIQSLILEIVGKVNFDVPLDKLPVQLSAAEKQKVGLLRGLLNVTNGGILLFDEVTTNLTHEEAKNLFTAIRDQFTKVSVIFVTHRTSEVINHADYVFDFLDGRIRAEGPIKLNEEVIPNSRRHENNLLARPQMVVNSEVALPAVELILGDPKADNGRIAIRSGEAVSLIAETTELADSLFRILCGQLSNDEFLPFIRHGETLLNNQSTANRRLAGWRYVSADRMQDGIFLGHSIRENLMARNTNGFRLFSKHQQNNVLELTRNIGDIERRLEDPVDLLSGGFKQRLILERELDSCSRVLVAHNPFQGVDARTRSILTQRLLDWVGTGRVLILLLNFDLPIKSSKVYDISAPTQRQSLQVSLRQNSS